MRKKYISLPKRYLSYSQMELWLRDRNRYKRYYFNDDKIELGGAAVDFGKLVADSLEDGESSGDAFVDAVLADFPRYEVRDEIMEVELKTKDGYIPLIAKPDTFKPTNLAFREYKTGQETYPWTYAKVQASRQLKFYTACIFLKYGKLPKDAFLDWAVTEYDVNTGTIVFTGKVHHFKFRMSMKEVLLFIGLITRVAKEIEFAWILHNSKK